MAGDEPVDLHALLRHSRGRGAPSDVQGEAKLDSLLRQHSQQQAKEDAKEAAPPNPLDCLREVFRDELVPAFEQLRLKYAADGVTLSFDPGPFLKGGRDITIVIEFAGCGMRYHGTVLPNSIAFQQTRFNRSDPGGLTASGPTLRTRGLNGCTFREFVCERIAAVVQAALSRRS